MSQLINIERTFLMIKPDGVKRGLIGDIYSRLERMGLKLVAARMTRATEEQARKNYPGTEEWLINLGEKTYINYKNDLDLIKADLGTTDKLEIGNKIYDGLVKYLSDGPVVISVWEGNHAVQVVRKLAGKTDPTLADIGSIRGDFGFDTPQFAVKSGRVVFRTIVHISDSQEEAQREIKQWFGKDYKYLGDYDRMDYTGMYETWE
jgi:nucleoside-diphosphate kinase